MLGHAQRYFLPDILYNKAKVYSWRFNLIQSSVHSFLFTSVDCIKCFWQFTISWWWMMWGVVIEKMCCTSLLCQHNELLLFLHRKQFSFAINMLHLKSNPVAIFVNLWAYFMPCMQVCIHHLRNLNPTYAEKNYIFVNGYRVLWPDCLGPRMSQQTVHCHWISEMSSQNKWRQCHWSCKSSQSYCLLSILYLLKSFGALPTFHDVFLPPDICKVYESGILCLTLHRRNK